MITPIYPADLTATGDDLVAWLLEAHRPGGRRLLLNMVTSLDGAIALEGRASGLGDDDDWTMFHALRAVSDVIIVGAGTARTEDYGPVKMTPEVTALRRSHGLADVPRIAVVTRRLALDPSARLFSDPGQRPYLLTGADAPSSPELHARADVLLAGEVEADPREAVRLLHDEGHQVILCEGGPTLNGQLVEADLVDELNLTLSPLLVSGPSPRMTRGVREVTRGFRLDRLMMGERMLFARYVRE